MLIGRYFREEYGSDFVFVTHYPGKKRPFYAMDDPDDTTFTLSFDCLFKGMEITTGGQRIHANYHMLMEKLHRRGMTEEGMEHYLMAFRYGMQPPRRPWNRPGASYHEAYRRRRCPRNNPASP